VRLLAWWMGGVLWVGCASQAADAVRVTHRTPKQPACEAVGRVEGQGTSEALARRRAREDAHAMGADTVVIDEPITKMPAGRTRVAGAALRCHAPATAQSAEASSPAADTAAAAADADTRESSAGDAAAPAAAAAGGVEPSEPGLEERLRSLQELHDKGLITQEDYDARRKELLQEL